MENEWTKKIEELEAENARLVALNDMFPQEIARLEDRVSEEYEAERADDRARIKELEAERDADRKREYGYSQQTVDALTLERDKLRAERNDWKARYQSVAEMHDALIAEFNEMRAENKRLRELVDGAKEIVEIANCTSPAQCKWKVEWMQKASKPRRRQAMNDINTRLCELLGCDVPRPKDICPTCGKTNTDGKMRFIDGADFISEKGRIDLLKRMRKRDDHEEFASFINPNHLWDTYLIDLLLDDTGALARVALEFLEDQA